MKENEEIESIGNKGWGSKGNDERRSRRSKGIWGRIR